MEPYLVTLLPIFFVVALLYASAGFGGGSSYLAILALYPIAFNEIRMVALLCNVVVVSGSLFIFYKNDLLKWRAILPLVLWSVPLAYLGGRTPIRHETFFLLLAITLLLAAVLMLFIKNKKKEIQLTQYSNGIIGAAIGYLSGLVGIGGGIFLSPVLHLSQWDETKKIAATSAAFIWLNSIAGLAGQFQNQSLNIDLGPICALLFAVLLGGQIGVRLTTYTLPSIWIRRITAILIFVVGVRILING